MSSHGGLVGMSLLGVLGVCILEDCRVGCVVGIVISSAASEVSAPAVSDVGFALDVGAGFACVRCGLLLTVVFSHLMIGTSSEEASWCHRGHVK